MTRRVFEPVLEQDERLADQRLRRDRPFGRQRMPGRHDEQQLLAIDRHRVQRRIVDRQRQQPEVGRARPQLAHQPRRAAGDDLDVDVGMALPVTPSAAAGRRRGRPSCRRRAAACRSASSCDRGCSPVVSRMSSNTRWLSCSSFSPVGVIWIRRPKRRNSGSLNSSSSSRICRLIADCETCSRAPAAVNEPLSAIARRISSCRRSIVRLLKC